MKKRFLEDTRKIRELVGILREGGIRIYEYFPEADTFVIYDKKLQVAREIPEYLKHLEGPSRILPEDRWKVRELFKGLITGPIEIKVMDEEGEVRNRIFDIVRISKRGEEPEVMMGYSKDITADRNRQEALERQARSDSLTSLYNHISGKEEINRYLREKNPYSSCGLMVLDVDYFKEINDTYGHLTGDRVLVELARLFVMLFDMDDVIMRAGGDEFVILLKDISHGALLKKAMKLVQSVRKLTFEENDCSVTCSVGVCFLPENVAGYTYDQLFENADWALYRAKENGRNRYAFCDNLKRFELSAPENEEDAGEIDARYLRNDIISTAFEIFDKMNSFEAAIDLLLKVIGIRFRLDRITIARADMKEKKAFRQIQWMAEGVPEVLPSEHKFTKEDFLTLFNSFDENGTAILQLDDMGMYSEAATSLLKGGGAKTIVYAAMYCEGKYTGAISYVVCDKKRYWSVQNRRQLGELTKIISAHLAKHMVMNNSYKGLMSSPEYDRLTGLLSFARFREETERIILSEKANSHMMIYCDFEGFKHFNKKYGYSVGDQMLKEFSAYIIGLFKTDMQVYFSRVVADQFILFMPYENLDETIKMMEEVLDTFIKEKERNYPDARVQFRVGVYPIAPECAGSAVAIDAANYARNQMKETLESCIVLYDEKLAVKQRLENEIINRMNEAMNNHEFQVYLQPKFSLTDFTVVGAEALVRWKRPDGSMLYPDSFIPLYEANGSIIELDFYIFEQVVIFLAENARQGRKQIPISINASIRHAMNPDTAERYVRILEKYGVSPEMVEIEMTETASADNYERVKECVCQLREAGIRTALDDFGAGYSLLNAVVDLPMNVIKLDRGFINTCEATERGINFLQQLVTLIKGLGYGIICEGVETMEQAQILKNAGCEEAQGYLFARPMPIEEYEKMVYQKDE